MKQVAGIASPHQIFISVIIFFSKSLIVEYLQCCSHCCGCVENINCYEVIVVSYFATEAVAFFAYFISMLQAAVTIAMHSLFAR